MKCRGKLSRQRDPQTVWGSGRIVDADVDVDGDDGDDCDDDDDADDVEKEEDDDVGG